MIMNYEDMDAYEIAEELMQRHPDARNSRRKLLFYFLKDVCDIPLKKMHKSKLMDSISFNSIGRAQREIQNDEDRLQALEEVEKERRRRAEQAREDPRTLYEDDRNSGGEKR